MNTDTNPRAEGSESARRHDFDALRAFAMLLGIALHAGLAFAPIPWLAMNDETSTAIGTFIEVLHGFRLPLFFIMSGFFSAMLLERRGVAGFLGHRWKRIALPLLLGSVTIIPAMWGVIISGHALQAVHPAPARERAAPDETEASIWRAAADGDLETVRRLTDSGTPVDSPDPRFFTLPLAWAATGDHAEVVELLLEGGANPNQRMGDENTPMHTACFFGASESARLMLKAGGDLHVSNRHGETPIEAMRHDAGVVAFISNLLAVEVSFERVEAGRSEIVAMLDTDSATGPARRNVLDGIMDVVSGEVFMHLWFLWHLCWLAGGLVLVQLLLRLLPWRSLPDVLVSTPLCLLGLVPLTALTQSWQANFGPDTSAALIPDPHVLLHYAVFFGAGVMMYCSARAADLLGRTWWVYLPFAALACCLALQILHKPAFVNELGLPLQVQAWLGPAMQSVFVWTASFGLIGVARRVLSRPNARIRYISDSSYWLYVAHLPVVVAGQFALAYVPFPPVVEFVGLTIATTLVLLLSYQWFVRYTWIGHLLNGRRVHPKRGGEPPHPVDRHSSSPMPATQPAAQG